MNMSSTAPVATAERSPAACAKAPNLALTAGSSIHVTADMSAPTSNSVQHRSPAGFVGSRPSSPQPARAAAETSRAADSEDIGFKRKFFFILEALLAG